MPNSNANPETGSYSFETVRADLIDGVVRSTMKEFSDQTGRRWRADLVSHGRTSGYLHARVHRPILQFTCLDARLARRYVGLPDAADTPVEDRSEAELRRLLEQASAQ